MFDNFYHMSKDYVCRIIEHSETECANFSESLYKIIIIFSIFSHLFLNDDFLSLEKTRLSTLIYL